MKFEINTDKIVENVVSEALERELDGKTIKQWMTEIAKHQWVSVKDRMPEEDDYRECHENEDGAVFWFNGNEIGMGWYYASTRKWSDLNDHEVKGVTRWRRLPEPPEEVTGDV